MLETLSSWYRLDTSNRLLPRCRIYHNVSLFLSLSHSLRPHPSLAFTLLCITSLHLSCLTTLSFHRSLFPSIDHSILSSLTLSLTHSHLSLSLSLTLSLAHSLQASRSRLHSAAEYGETDILRLLLSLNADPDLRDKVSTCICTCICTCTCARAHDSELTVFALNDVASAGTDRYRLPHMPKKQHSLSTISISNSISI